ncbi:BREX-2 system phosphatase PglZ [Micromonospora sp. WMMD967]|uniref:BREX-2 system phosphatase PglZ n=1 Tax=Micromonospora sp. WMMD967 TaxID=3016101 RepID=UPI0024173DEE|nr:BREX-2 system phosphatase PglZ [Micromonospora sp. WMMD967]MDG4838331.1 BREX-2 system phosphatase PglZ [Micromonospora sp. WMMD967]
MTVAVATTRVSASMVLAIVDEARAKNYGSGVIGIRGVPDRAITADLQHQGQTVRVRAAESALAARELLGDHRDGDWLVVVTDRDDGDLGAGILAHFIWQRLRSPDPWEAVRTRFAATGIDPALTSRPDNRELATALVAATPQAGWPAAPAGVLTRTHALGAVAATHLGFDTDTADVLGVLRWSISAQSVASLGALRRSVGDLLADTTLDWIAQRAGSAAGPIRALLSRGELADVVPLGLVLRLLIADRYDAPAAHQAQLALVRLEPRWGDPRPSPVALAALGQAADTLLSDLIHDRRADDDVARSLDRADVILTQLQAEPLARYSELLASGLRARFVALADALRRAIVSPGHVDNTNTVETAWAAVQTHRLEATTPLRAPFEAAVRLVRWLADVDPPSGAASDAAALGALVRQYLDSAAWADAAINDAFGGVDDPSLSSALHAVVTAAQKRRRAQERRFARALASAPIPAGRGVPADPGTIWYLEQLLPGCVIPLARKTPVLLLVLDGMSTAVATEILSDATTRLGWLEAALPGAGNRRRSAALAALPSITEVSRASLLTGRLTRGQQSEEQHGYAEITAKGGKITARLFHKKAVDTTAAGWSVSPDVGGAIDDIELSLVTVVLNTIDDALDRSDPAGTVWTADAVKHLEPLLARAAAAGRTVVVTSDHGHIVERRQGSQRSYPDISSARSRPATAPVQDDEIEVSGPRVLTDGHRAVLAVDETLRYGPLKAGYHGGASAAEVVVPVVVLVPDETRNRAGLELLLPQEPAWWLTSVPAPRRPAEPPAQKAATTKSRGVRQDSPTLFDLGPQATEQPAVTLGRAIVTSSVYKAQRKITGRLIVTDDQIASIIDALVGAAANRLAPTLAAQALGVAQTRLRGALTQVQQLLNIEGYAVLAADPATGTVTLDVTLLTEQFEVPS